MWLKRIWSLAALWGDERMHLHRAGRPLVG
jgi:hypothetical protein